MGNTFEVESWEEKEGRHQWILEYSGEYKEEAFECLERLKGIGKKCVRLVWRG